MPADVKFVQDTIMIARDASGQYQGDEITAHEFTTRRPITFQAVDVLQNLGDEDTTFTLQFDLWKEPYGTGDLVARGELVEVVLSARTQLEVRTSLTHTFTTPGSYLVRVLEKSPALDRVYSATEYLTVIPTPESPLLWILPILVGLGILGLVIATRKVR